MPVNYSRYNALLALYDRARIFLEDVETNDKFLEILDRHLRNMAYDHNARDQACKEGREDDEKYRLEIVDNIMTDMNAGSLDYRIVFLLERGMNEDELKAEISREITPCP